MIAEFRIDKYREIKLFDNRRKYVMCKILSWEKKNWIAKKLKGKKFGRSKLFFNIKGKLFNHLRAVKIKVLKIKICAF